MRQVNAIHTLYFTLIWYFTEEGKMQKERDSHPSILFLNQTPTYNPTGSQRQCISLLVLLPLLNFKKTPLNDL